MLRRSSHESRSRVSPPVPVRARASTTCWDPLTSNSRAIERRLRGRLSGRSCRTCGGLPGLGVQRGSVSQHAAALLPLNGAKCPHPPTHQPARNATQVMCLAGAPRQAVLRRAHSWLHGQTGHRSFLVDRGHLWRTAVRLLTTDQRIVHGQRLHEAGASRTGALGHPEPR